MTDAKIKKQAAQLALTREVFGGVKDVSVQLIKAPAVSMALGVASVEYLARHGYINETERALLAATIISTAYLEAFKPITIGGGQ